MNKQETEDMDGPQASDETLHEQARLLESNAAFPVIGLGASAGGIAALCAFFDHVPADSGMAYVVILHLSAERKSHLADLLQKHTPMPVTQVTEPVMIEADHVYVVPPSKLLVVSDGMLTLTDPDGDTGKHMPIDHFFRTLADTYRRYAGAVILSGAGSDGSIGIKRVKEHAGVVLVQDPQEAEFDGMPRMSIAEGLADFVLPVAAMPDILVTYWRRDEALALPADPAEEVEQTPSYSDALREIFAILRVRTGHDFSRYKRPTLLRRIGRRMQVTGASDLETYLALLRSRDGEVQALLRDLLISVTNFFRDHKAWQVLEGIIMQLFAGKQPHDQIRVWVTACATGEEAYSVAILLHEYAERHDYAPSIQIFATDIDEDAITVARQGWYPDSIAGDITPTRLERYFVPDHGGYRIKQDLRDMVLFARHNVLHDAPFSRLDLITCRNLLIYLNRDAQEQVMRTFHFSLRPDGYLLLGSSESTDGVPNLFTEVDKTHRLYQRRNTEPMLPPPLGAQTLSRLVQQPPPRSQETRNGVTSFADLHQKLLTPYLPPSIIVNEEGDIVYLSHAVGRYLHFGEGQPSHKLLHVVRPELRLELRTALFGAHQRGERADVRRARVQVDGQARLVDMVVQPITEPDWARGYSMVVFNDVGEASQVSPQPPVSDTMISQLEQELQRTKDQLRSTIEQYETAVEEYKAANEELQAINEELRAASEELETSKEELQSVNEELTTLNQELKHKLDELSQANNDLQNLMAATPVGTVFLDQQLRIKRYTPSAQTVFNVIPTDINRPLDHITSSLRYDGLGADATAVLNTLVPATREVESTNGQWYTVRLSPYRTLDDRIAGVVITLADITENKRTEAVLRERARLLDLSNDAIIVRDVDNRIQYWNHGATALYGWTRDEALGQDLHSFLRTEFEIPLEQLLVTLKQHDQMEGEVVQVTRDGRRITLWCRWALDRDAAGDPGAILTTYNDITDRKRAEEHLRESETRFRAVANLVPDLLWSNDPSGWTDWFNQRWFEYTGQTPEEASGDGWFDAIHPDDREQSRRNFQSAIERGEPLSQEHRIRGNDGEYRWFLVHVVPVRNEEGQIVRWYGAATDIHEQRMALAEAHAALHIRDQFLSIASHELRTPLTALMGYASLLRRVATQEPDAQRSADMVVRQTHRLNRMIEHLLDVAKLQRGQFTIDPQPIDLGALVDRIVDEFRTTQSADNATHTIAVTLPDEAVPIMGDADRLEAVLLNLLSNALKYSPAGGPIHVRVSREANEAIVEVQDLGIGIPEQEQTRLFEPFYRAQNVGQGTSGFGLGLYIVAQVVQRHGGHIEVRSLQGRGSTFAVRLPMEEATRELSL